MTGWAATEEDMANVVKIVATDSKNKHFEEDVADNKTWHAVTTVPDGPRTICGIQLEGDDGYGPGKDKEGKVTCQVCRSIIKDIQRIKKWR